MFAGRVLWTLHLDVPIIVFVNRAERRWLAKSLSEHANPKRGRERNGIESNYSGDTHYNQSETFLSRLSVVYRPCQTNRLSGIHAV
jgi:hypothetical protein